MIDAEASAMRMPPERNSHIPASYRKAALLLHAMPVDDRRWLLSQLPSEQSEALAALLKELESLGIPVDKTLYADILTQQHIETEGADVMYLTDAIATRLVEVLQNEPTALISVLLSWREWPWKKDFLEALPLEKRREVLGHLQNKPQGQALKTAAIDLTCRKLRRHLSEKGATYTFDVKQSAICKVLNGFWHPLWKKRSHV